MSPAAPAESASRGGMFTTGGRFTQGLAPVMEKFNSSIAVDQRMWSQDIEGSIAYTHGLLQMGIIDAGERAELERGLKLVEDDWRDGKVVIVASDEDIHTANERLLTTKILPALAGKLHTGRSRNDQVATDTKLWVIQNLPLLKAYLQTALRQALDLADREKSVLMCGYTHLQPAQPVRFSHWLLSHIFPLLRDLQKLEVLEKSDTLLACPLGSSALAGNPYNLDRTNLLSASTLGKSFTAGPTWNSIDAVSDRDYIIDFLHFSTSVALHLSQFSEDLIIQNLLKTVALSDLYSTGSSLMPQKKNPDSLELIRGKAGALIGMENGMKCTLKGLPRSYNKDLQGDKLLLFQAFESVEDMVRIFGGVCETLTVNKKKMEAQLEFGMLATELADYLVLNRNCTFRESHHISGGCVRLAEELNLGSIRELTFEQLVSVDARFDKGIEEIWDYERAVERRKCQGGCSLVAVEAAIEEGWKRIGGR